MTREPEMTNEEQNLLRRLIRKNSFTGKHLEVGTAAGGSLCLMMKALNREGSDGFVVVDRMTYFENQHQCVLDNIKLNGLDHNNVRFIVENSRVAYKLAMLEGLRFDFILVDAGHKALPVMLDCRWASLLNVGGIVCFHDYADRCPGVIWAVDRFLRKTNNYVVHDMADSLLAIRKIGEDAGKWLSPLDYLFATWAQLCHRKLLKNRGRIGAEVG